MACCSTSRLLLPSSLSGPQALTAISTANGLPLPEWRGARTRQAPLWRHPSGTYPRGFASARTGLTARSGPRLAPVRSRLKRWQAIDIARTFLEKYPLSHLNLRAELLSDYGWAGDQGKLLHRTRSDWYFGYRVGLPPDPYGYHRMSVRELQLRGLLNPDGSPREDDRRTASVHQTWRVWYQTGWAEPEEIASLVQRGELPQEALGWGRQPLEEFILVHARTGAIQPVQSGRGNVRYHHGGLHLTNREDEIDSRWYGAIHAAMKRAEHWIERPIPMKKSSPAPEGNAKHPKDELFHGYTAPNPTPAEQDPSSSGQSIVSGGVLGLAYLYCHNAEGI